MRLVCGNRRRWLEYERKLRRNGNHEAHGVFDTNILIDLFKTVLKLRMRLIMTRPHRAISLITWMEVMVGAANMVMKRKRQRDGALKLLMCLGISLKEAFSA
jgi:hypothetical protein